jgi:hypothetical protein
MEGEVIFNANEIRPWVGQGMMNGSGAGRGGRMMNSGANGNMMR